MRIQNLRTLVFFNRILTFSVETKHERATYNYSDLALVSSLCFVLMARDVFKVSKIVCKKKTRRGWGLKQKESSVFMGTVFLLGVIL